MGFMSYSLRFYEDALLELENNSPDAQAVYRAKQLLKMLDDLVDEGYTALAESVEQEYYGVSRLRTFLRENHAEPFSVSVREALQDKAAYYADEQELVEAISLLTEKARSTEQTSDNPFLKELLDFCNWIGYENDTAYIFLLRDTMLPYIRFLSEHRENCHPWLLGRKTLQLLTGLDNTDDDFRLSIMEALESGACRSYDEFCSFVLPDIRNKLRRYPETESFLTGLLREIKQKKLLIVESGCYGTFPMLLMSLDSRADMRMYTAVPYLADVYADRIYTRAYENNRLFETLYSQDLYFRLSGLHSGRFYVHTCRNAEIEKLALAEINSLNLN